MPHVVVFALRWIARLGAAGLLALPAVGLAQSPPASAGSCPSCASLSQVETAYKTAESQLDLAEGRITSRLQDLAGKALSAARLTDAERAERTRLETERQKITAARTSVKKTLENLDKARQICARPCPSGTGPNADAASRAIAALDKLLAPPPPPPPMRAKCPECEPAAQAYNAASEAHRKASRALAALAEERATPRAKADMYRRILADHEKEIARHEESIRRIKADPSPYFPFADSIIDNYAGKIVEVRKWTAHYQGELRQAETAVAELDRKIAEAQRVADARGAEATAALKALLACEQERCPAPAGGETAVPAWIFGLDPLPDEELGLFPGAKPVDHLIFGGNVLEGLAEEAWVAYVISTMPPPDPATVARRSALCPACEPAAQAVRAAAHTTIGHLIERGRIDEEIDKTEFLLKLERESIPNRQKANDRDREALKDPALPAEERRQKERDIERRLQAMGEDPNRAIEFVRKLTQLRERRAVLVGELIPAAQAAEAAAEDALSACNQTRCGGVQLSGVIGVIGNDPFFPPNPIGTLGGNPPPVTGSGPGTLQFNSASYGGAEGGAVLITVVRSGGSAGIVSVHYETLRGSAGEEDFKPANGTLRWEDRDPTPKSFSIALASDTVVEEVESFSVILSNPGGGATLGSPSTATVSITDTGAQQPPQPAGTLQFSQSGYSVGEAAGSITITVTRSGGSAGTVTVQYFTGAGSATAGSDYQQANGVLTWGPGDAGSKTFTVPIINDTTPEGDEGFFVTLNGPTGGATLGAPSTANITIVDDDAASAPCGATGNAWTPNAGTYMCTGNCEPSSPQALSVNGDVVSITQFHQGGTATFQGCGPVLTSTRNDLRYFLQSTHTATISRSGNTAFSVSVRSPTGTCGFGCNKLAP